MADETLPAEWALDMAAKACLYKDWTNFDIAPVSGVDRRRSVIAHARTLEALAKHDPSIKPVDEDLLIAREICARVVGCEDDGEILANSFRAGLFDAGPSVQFTLSMLKRDPEALAAFRKEKGL